MKKITIFTIALLTVCSVYSGAVSTGSYKVVHKISVEGNEKWDYLFSDDQAGRLYVSHGSQVQVIDEVSREAVGKITGLKGVHGIAIAPGWNKGFISSGKDSSVTIFDTNTLEVIKRVVVTGISPDAILFDAFSQKVFVCNGHSNNMTVIDAATNEIVSTIALTGNPEFSVTNGKGMIYINLESASSIAVINASTFEVVNVWPIAPGAEPTGLALDNETHRLFCACTNKLMMVVDAETGKVISGLPIGDKTDGAGFDPFLKCAYSSNGDETMTVVKEDDNDQYRVLENVKTQTGARTIAVNRGTHHLYLPAADFEPATDGHKGKMIPGTFVILEIAPE
ncbi:MAG: YncE family protein [Bacteroidota bacterium]|nr:YncE family protein [Bacteroidota bacterium]